MASRSAPRLTYEQLETLTLRRGKHLSREDGVCALEAAAWLAGESHTDHPACVSPVIAVFIRTWQDNLPDDATRTRLLRHLLPRIINTVASREVETRRAWLAVDWLMRAFVPRWLRAVDLHAQADALTHAAPVLSSAAWAAIAPLVCDACAVIARKAAESPGCGALDMSGVVRSANVIAATAAIAAWRAGWPTGATTACDTACDAACDAVGLREVFVASPVFTVDAVIAATQGARDAAEAQARLAPIIADLHQSAVGLVERMVVA